MSVRELSLGIEPDEPRMVIAGRRVWRALRVVLHLLAGSLELIWRRAGRDPHRADIAAAKQRWCLRLLEIMAVELRVHGPLRGGGVLLVSNHVSWLDIPVIAAARPCYFLSKDEVSRWPLIGWIARSVGTLFIRRGGGESRAKVKEIRERLGRGQGVLVFPEGTTTDGTGVRRFFAPLFAAAEGGVPVQPVAIRYRDAAGRPDTGVAFIGDDEFHHHLWRLLGRRRLAVDLIFGAPLSADADPRVTAGAARQRILGALGG